MDDLDRILASEKPLATDPEFTATVMQRIRDEMRAQRPLAFPWPALMAGLILHAALLVVGLGFVIPSPSDISGQTILANFAAWWNQSDLAWPATTAAATLLILIVALRISELPRTTLTRRRLERL